MNITEYQIMEKTSPLISIIVPVFNEEETIDEVLSRIISLGKKISIEIIVVDDGSEDNSLNIIKNHDQVILIQHDNNYGKGAAIQTGIRKSTGDIIIIQDADLEYLPEEIPRIVEPILSGKADVVFGSRFIGKMEGMSYSHFLGNRILSIVAQILYKSNITDIMTGYKAMKRHVADNIKITKSGFDVEIEMTCKILKSYYRIMEVPISYKYRTSGESKITYWDGLRSLMSLFSYMF